jgi:hypothetical protein
MKCKENRSGTLSAQRGQGGSVLDWSAADAAQDEHREGDDDQDDENGPQHGEAPSG